MTGAVEAIPSAVAALASGGGLISSEYRFSTSIVAADPGAGRFRYDNAVVGLVSELFIDDLNSNGTDVSNFLALISNGDRLYIQTQSDAAAFQIWNVIADAVDNTGWFTIAIELESAGDDLANNARCLIVWLIDGDSHVLKVGTPVDNQVAVFTGPDAIEGDPNFDWNGERLRLESDVITPIDNLNLEIHNSNSVINPDGWILVAGVPGIFDGELIVSDDPTAVVSNLNVRFTKNNAAVFDIGARVADNSSFGSGTAGALTFFMPHDTTGRTETKISFVGVVGGTGNEGVFSIEGFAYGDAGLQFHRAAHFVIDSDYTIRAEMLGNLSVLAGYIQSQLFTDTELDDITDAANTDKGKIQGAQVFNSSQNVPVWAVGNADGDVWVDGAGTTINTPV